MSKVRTILLLAAIIGVAVMCGAAFGGDGPVAYWKFDEGMGQTAYDWVGGNNGTLVGDASWTEAVIGAYGLQFDGLGNRVLCDTSTFGFADATFTVSAWFCTTAGGAIIAEGGYQNGGWFVYIHSLDGRARVQLKGTGPAGNADAYRAATTDSYLDGLWHHVAAVVTTSTVSSGGNHADIYIDGSLVDVEEAQIYAYRPSAENLSIGARGNGTAAYYGGLLDEIMVFDRGLSGKEIAAIYADGLKGLGYPCGPKPAINMLESVMAEKQAMLEKTQGLLNLEAQAYEELDQILARGDYGDLKKGDIVTAKQKAQSAMQHEQQTIDTLSKSIAKLLDSLRLLGWDPAALPQPLAR